MKTTTKLLPLTTFVAAAMSFALPAWADDYTWAGDSAIGTDLLGYFEDADDEASAMLLGEKMLDEDALASLYATHDASSGSNGFASNSISASSGTEISGQVEITQSTSTTLKGASLTPVPTTNSSEAVTVRQSTVAMSTIFEESTEQYTEAGKSYYEQVSTSDSGYAVTTYSVASFLGNFDSVGNSDSQYGTSYLSNDDGGIDSGIVYYATRTWTGGSGIEVDGVTYYYWNDTDNWNGDVPGTSDTATFNADGGENTTVTVVGTINVSKITVTGGVEYTFEYADDASLTTTSDVTIGSSANDNSSLTITGGENTFSKKTGTVYLYLGYATNSTGSLTITGGTNSFSSVQVRVGYGSGSSGSLTITGGNNTFGTVYLAYKSDGSSTGTMTISGGNNGFSNDVYVGYYGTGSLTITDGTNNFSHDVKLGYYSGSTGSLTITGGTNNFSRYVNVGNSSSPGSLTIWDGKNTFSDYAVYVGYGSNEPGEFYIFGGENTFSSTVCLGYNIGSEGTLTITGGTNWFSGNIEIGHSGTGTMTISDGNNTFSGNYVYLGRSTSSSEGELYISGGTNTFSATVYVGYYAGATGSLTITSGTNTFSTVYVGDIGTGTGSGTASGNGDATGTMTITGGNTTFSGTTTIADNNCSLTIGGGTETATVILETQIGTTTNGSVTISKNANIVLSGALLDRIVAMVDSTEGGSVTIIEAASITINGTTLDNQSSDALAELIGSSIYAEGYDLTWDYDGAGTLSVVAAAVATPEPSMFSLFFGLGAIGLVATRRRRRKA